MIPVDADALKKRLAESEAALGRLRSHAAALEARLSSDDPSVRILPGNRVPASDEVVELRRQMAGVEAHNERLMTSLRELRDQIAAKRDEIDKLTQPPMGFATMLATHLDGTADVSANGRKMRVNLHPDLVEASVATGSEVILNESMNVVEVTGFGDRGEVVSLVQVLDGGTRARVSARGDDERIVALAATLHGTSLKPGDQLLMDPGASVIVEVIPRSEVSKLALEEVPDVTYSDVGGLDDQIEQITDAVELPFLHADLYAEHQLPAPKGILLYGPPGCGKTLIAKAVANSLARKVAASRGAEHTKSYFLSIKGPELLNKYVGETERHIRMVFEQARDSAADGTPVIVFFDEMESLFRTRGTGISSDIESTIVPQLLAEIDGVEALKNVIVIGASNREDLIDPAILRPGRLDVKIKVERPDGIAAAAIFSRYLTAELPLDADEVKSAGGGDPDKAVRAMIDLAIEEMYRTDETTEFLEVTYQNGDKETMYFKDFASGAMIENIVRRAKQRAVKRLIQDGTRGIRSSDFVAAVKQEFKEHEDLPNTTNPDDWAKISGKKGEPIVFVRTLVRQDADTSEGGRSIEGVATGQYL